MNPDDESVITILGFGDSLTAGTPGYDPDFGGDERSQYGFWLLASGKSEGQHRITFANQGVPGELAQLMHGRLEQLLQRERYDAVIVLGGSNDIGWGYPVHAIFNTLTNLWSLVCDSGARVVACTVPPIGSVFPDIQVKQGELNSLILNAPKEIEELVIVDLFSVLADSDNLLLPAFDSGDGLHLSIQGYRQMGETIWRSISQYLD
ncbi:MAG: GDSL-type esterase/lipase family protein [Candidatus Thorarchaeota archaeon]